MTDNLTLSVITDMDVHPVQLLCEGMMICVGRPPKNGCSLTLFCGLFVRLAAIHITLYVTQHILSHVRYRLRQEPDDTSTSRTGQPGKGLTRRRMVDGIHEPPTGGLRLPD